MNDKKRTSKKNSKKRAKAFKWKDRWIYEDEMNELENKIYIYKINNLTIQFNNLKL